MLHRAAGDQDAAQRNDDRSDYEQKEPSRQPCGNPENPGSSPRLDPLPEQKRDAADQKGPNQGKSPEQPNVSLGGRRFSLQLGLEIEGFQLPLLLQIGFSKVGTGEGIGVEALRVAAGRNKGWVGIVDVHCQHPRLTSSLRDELEGAVRSPFGLMQVGWDAVVTLPERVQVSALVAHPVGVVMTLGPVVTGSVTEPPIAVTVIKSRLGSAGRTLEVELPHHSTIIATVGELL